MKKNSKDKPILKNFKTPKLLLEYLGYKHIDDLHINNSETIACRKTAMYLEHWHPEIDKKHIIDVLQEAGYSVDIIATALKEKDILQNVRPGR